MMKFFVPHAADEAEAESCFRSFAAFVQVAAPERHEDRICGLDWVHNGCSFSVQVGQPMPAYYELRGEPALAIFDAGDHFRICTPSRGGVRGDPILAGKRQSRAAYFERAPEAGLGR